MCQIANSLKEYTKKGGLDLWIELKKPLNQHLSMKERLMRGDKRSSSADKSLLLKTTTTKKAEEDSSVNQPQVVYM